jgi:hypothetical protein
MSTPGFRSSMLIERNITVKTDHLFLLRCVHCFIVFLCLCSCSSEKPETAKIAEHAGDRMTTGTSIGTESREAASLSQPNGPGVEKGPEGLSKNFPKVDKGGFRLETVNGVDRLKVVAEGSDRNGNKVPLKFQWIKNDEPAGEGDAISGFRRGDKISVTITPFDDQGYGLSKNISTEIKNTTPIIIEHQEMNFDGKVWSYQARAIDADGDPLSYSLKSAPQNMTIDPSTGSVKWNVPADFNGEASFTVCVSDGHGGEATQSLTLGISPQQKKP